MPVLKSCQDCEADLGLVHKATLRCAECKRKSGNAKARRWKDNNPEAHRASMKRVRAKSEKIRASKRKWNQEHRELCVAMVMDWKRRNPEKSKAIEQRRYRNMIARLHASGKYEEWREHVRAMARARRALQAKPTRRLRTQHRAEPRVVLQWPFVTSRTPQNEILLTINGLIPNGIRGDLRGDIGNDILVAALEDQTVLIALLAKPAGVRRFITAAKKQNYERAGWGVESIDLPMRDGRSWHDVLESPTG